MARNLCLALAGALMVVGFGMVWIPLGPITAGVVLGGFVLLTEGGG